MGTALKKSKERFETEMSELGSSRDMSGRESEAAGKISGLERKIQYVNTDRVGVMCGVGVVGPSFQARAAFLMIRYPLQS